MDAATIYDQGAALEERIAAQVRRTNEIQRLQRQRITELLGDPDWHPHIDGTSRSNLAVNQANLDLYESRPDLCDAYDEEEAKLMGILRRNEAIVSAGWASQFEHTSQQTRWMAEVEERAARERGTRALEPASPSDKPSDYLDRAAGALDAAVQLTGDENTAELGRMEERLDELAGHYRSKGR